MIPGAMMTDEVEAVRDVWPETQEQRDWCLGAQLAISVHNCPVLADTRFPMSIFKRTQRKYVKKAYRVRNWREYEAGLRNRGSLTASCAKTRPFRNRPQISRSDAPWNPRRIQGISRQGWLPTPGLRVAGDRPVPSIYSSARTELD